MKTIAWDVDDTLNDVTRLWLERWFLPRNKGCSLSYRGMTANPPHILLGVSHAAYLRSFDEFRLSGIYSTMKPRREVLAWFKKNGARYRHIAVTAVPLKAAHESASWVYRHFGRWIRTFHIVPSPRKGEKLPIYDSTKADFMHYLGGCAYFLDDAPANIMAARRTVGRCLTVPAPWNKEPGGMAELLGKIK